MSFRLLRRAAQVPQAPGGSSRSHPISSGPVAWCWAVAAVLLPAPAFAQAHIPNVAAAEAGRILPDVISAESQVAPVTLDSVYSLVLRQSTRIQAAEALARAAELRVAGASLPPDPELQLGFMNYMLPGLRPDPAMGMTELQLMQSLPLPGKLSAARRASRARSDAAHARVGDVAWEMRMVAATAFYERYELEGRVAISLATKRLLEDASALASAMYRVGTGRQADVLRARVEIARMDEEVIRMRAMADVATTQLMVAANAPAAALEGTTVLPAFPDTVPSREALEDIALRSRPLLAAGSAEVRAAQADQALARRELWPDLKVGVQYAQRSMDMGTDRMGSLMVGASIPIFAGSRQMQMREEAAAMQAMASAELESMRTETVGRIAAVHAELLSVRRLAALYHTTVLPQAEAASTSALASYRSGSVDFMTVLESRMGVNRYQQELLALEAAEGRAWAEMEMLVGSTLLTTTASTATMPQTTGGMR